MSEFLESIEPAARVEPADRTADPWADHLDSGGAEREPEEQWSPTFLDLATTTAVVGEYRWIENALYAMLGEWVTDMPVAAVQVHLDGQSLRHAWHADLWADRLPVLAGTDPAGVTAPSPRSACATTSTMRSE